MFGGIFPSVFRVSFHLYREAVLAGPFSCRWDLGWNFIIYVPYFMGCGWDVCMRWWSLLFPFTYELSLRYGLSEASSQAEKPRERGRGRLLPPPAVPAALVTPFSLLHIHLPRRQGLGNAWVVSSDGIIISLYLSHCAALSNMQGVPALVLAVNWRVMAGNVPFVLSFR